MGALLPFVLRACCGGMCWPRERPANRSRRGSGCTRGFNFLFWGLFHMLGRGWHERVRGGGFNPLRGATTGVVMRRRATSGEMARGGLVFVFSLEVAPVSEGDSFTRSGVVRHACRLRRDGTRIAFCFCGLWEVLCVSLMAVAGAGMRSRASRDAFPSGAWERHRFNGGAVAVCFEGCCGGMCWPQERPANRSRRWSGSTRG